MYKFFNHLLRMKSHHPPQFRPISEQISFTFGKFGTQPLQKACCLTQAGAQRTKFPINSMGNPCGSRTEKASTPLQFWKK
jgi:hypothetical protein